MTYAEKNDLSREDPVVLVPEALALLAGRSVGAVPGAIRQPRALLPRHGLVQLEKLGREHLHGALLREELLRLADGRKHCRIWVP
eukprot:CAMPEP_0180377182 /NCGR_PEP_ID=MMETSP0989-20121125/23919_1 /TAXON_ID=697907 /ORGANISM="non described non described, Strain CCMP2293" /LENGTH=84 /DNA_ID=CAMNT_0022375661 /DNA_START=341 /DNA_END=592 /DNA_ORIENTATION=-